MIFAVALKLYMKFLNSMIENNIRIFQRSFEMQAFVRRATAEYDIRLSMCECSIIQVYRERLLGTRAI